MELIAVCDSKTNTAPDFPIGWWSVARSHELKPGDVTSVTALDRELVVTGPSRARRGCTMPFAPT